MVYIRAVSPSLSNREKLERLKVSYSSAVCSRSCIRGIAESETTYGCWKDKNARIIQPSVPPTCTRTHSPLSSSTCTGVPL